MGWLPYLLNGLPNAIVLVAALMIGLFPKAIIELESRPKLRRTIASILGILAIAIWITSAVQMRSLDLTLSGLQTTKQASGQYESLNEKVNAIETHMVTVPRLAVHFSNGLGIETYQESSGLLQGVTITINNDGDDGTIDWAQAIGLITPTPPIATTYSEIRVVRRRLGELLAQGKLIKHVSFRHGESQTVSAMTPITSDEAAGFTNGSETLLYGFVFDVRTAHAHEAIYYCGFYQGFLPVIADEQCRPTTQDERR
jgi:hypothetical protein